MPELKEIQTLSLLKLQVTHSHYVEVLFIIEVEFMILPIVFILSTLRLYLEGLPLPAADCTLYSLPDRHPLCLLLALHVIDLIYQVVLHR